MLLLSSWSLIHDLPNSCQFLFVFCFSFANFELSCFRGRNTYIISTQMPSSLLVMWAPWRILKRPLEFLCHLWRTAVTLCTKGICPIPFCIFIGFRLNDSYIRSPDPLFLVRQWEYNSCLVIQILGIYFSKILTWNLVVFCFVFVFVFIVLTFSFVLLPN